MKCVSGNIYMHIIFAYKKDEICINVFSRQMAVKSIDKLILKRDNI